MSNNVMIRKQQDKADRKKRRMASPVFVMRRARGWTQKQLAAKVGCPHQLVHLWEDGRNLPGKAYLDGLAKAFGRNPELLFRDMTEYSNSL